MSDKFEVANTVSRQGRVALGISLGLAFSIPIAMPAADANPGNGNGGRANSPYFARQNRANRDVQLNIQPVEDVKFNLNSGRAQFTAGNLGNFNSLTINVGGRDKVVNLDTKLSAAELVAAQQILNGGQQTISLKANGAANGGTFTIDAGVLTALDKSVGGSIESLTISKGLQVIDKDSGIDLSGTLRNFGSFLAASDVAGTTDIISADSIVNHKSGSFGSYSGSDMFGADLVLNAQTFIGNQGSISSAGNLTINAPVVHNDGGSISAGNNVNVNTQNLINTGAVQANAGNINVNSNVGLAVDGFGGTMQSDSGSIAFSANNQNLDIYGGSLQSQTVDLSAGTGTINATFEDASGTVNASACIIHLHSLDANGSLDLGVIDATGDPLITSKGDITITNAITATGGAPLTLIAGKNIVTGAGNTGLNTSGAADGGDLTLIAGASFKDKKGITTVSKKSKTGGLIDLTGGNGGSAALAGIDTTGGTGVGGDVQLIAYAASGKKAGDTGKVFLPTALFDTTGATGDGNFTIIAGAKTGTTITSNATIDGGNISFSAATPTGAVKFDSATGLQDPNTAFKPGGTGSGNIDLTGGLITPSGDFSVLTKGTFNINGTAVVNLDTDNSTATLNVGALNIGATGKFIGTDKSVATAVVEGATTVDGITQLGTFNLETDTLTINVGGRMEDAVDVIDADGAITVNGLLGRDPAQFDPNRPTSTFDITSKGAFTVANTGKVSGDGSITASSFTNNGTAIGSIAYKASSKGKKGVISFSNFGVIDGLNVSVDVGSGTIFNAAGAFLQATKQMVEADVPTLTLTASVVNNEGHIEAIGRPKQTDGALIINSSKDLTIIGVDGGFETQFSSSVALNADGDIEIGGNNGVVNNNPFSLLNVGLGNFKVNTTGKFISNMPGVTVTSDGEGNNGEISFIAESIEYNGVGVAPNFALSTTGDAKSIGKMPITVNLSSNKSGITIGGGPGEISAKVTGFDVTSTTTFITPSELNVDMAFLDNGGTGLVFTGTKNLLINGNIIGGDNVTITTASKNKFEVGAASKTGITGIGSQEGVSANKILTINAPGGFIINTDSKIVGGEAINVNAPFLTVENLGDAGTKNFTLNPGDAPNTSYSNFNPAGLLKSTTQLNISTPGTLTLTSSKDKNVETVLTIGKRFDGPGGLTGGGTFNFTASELKFSSKGINFIAASSGPAEPNGGEVLLNLTGNKTVQIGLGNGKIRANVLADPLHFDPEGSGDFRLTSAGNIVSTNTDQALIFGDGGAFELTSTTSTVTVRDIGGLGFMNLFSLESNSNTPLLMTDGKGNGVLDKGAFLLGGRIAFDNNGGDLVTNGVGLFGVAYEFFSSTKVDFTKNAGFTALDTASGDGGEILVNAPVLVFNNKTGLTLEALGGPVSGAVIDVNSSGPATAGNLKVGPAGTGGTLFVDVSFAQGKGANVSLSSGGQLLIDMNGLDFGFSAAANKDSALTLNTIGGGPITINNASALNNGGLAFGTVTVNSSSVAPFLLSGANKASGNGFSDGALIAGTVIINPLAGKGIINTEGYLMTTNNLQLSAATINFDQQVIAVAPNLTVGDGNATGDGGSITITADNFTFNKAGGVLFQAKADPTGTNGGIVTITSNATKTLNIGVAGFSFDVSNPDVGPTEKAGRVEVNSNGSDITVDGTAFTFGNLGGTLDLETKGQMLFSNVAALNAFNLDLINLKTDATFAGKSSPFAFGSATTNGFVDVNPVLMAVQVSIESNGNSAGIDTSTGTVLANVLNLKTAGAINFASGGGLTVTADPITGNGGTMNLEANSLTQSGGAAGYLLSANGTTGNGGTINVKVTGSNPLIVGAGGLSVEAKNAGGKAAGIIDISNGGNIIADFDFINIGSGFTPVTGSITLSANGILNANNVVNVQTIDLGTLKLSSRSSQAFVLGGAAAGANGIMDNGLVLNMGTVDISNSGIFTNATIGGTVTVGSVDSITVTDSSLPGGFVTVTYTVVDGDNRDSVATGLADAINNDPSLQALGVSASASGSIITLSSTANNTSFSAEPAKGAKITLETIANGGDIEQGTLNSASAGGITTQVNLTANGNIGKVGAPIQLNGTKNGTITINAGLDANINSGFRTNSLILNVGGKADVDFNLGPGLKIGNVSGTVGSLDLNVNTSFDPSSQVTIGSLATTNGDLVVTSNATKLSVAAGAVITSFNGNIVLNNTLTLSSVIEILDDAVITGSGAIQARNQGNVYIMIGQIPPAITTQDGTPPAGVPPANIIETAGGQVTFGSNLNPAGSITSDATAKFQALGRDLAFSTGPRPATAITVGKNAVITADPPSTSGGIADILAAHSLIPQRNGGAQARTVGASTPVSVATTRTAGSGLARLDQPVVDLTYTAGGGATVSSSVSANTPIGAAINGASGSNDLRTPEFGVQSTGNLSNSVNALGAAIAPVSSGSTIDFSAQTGTTRADATATEILSALNSINVVSTNNAQLAGITLKNGSIAANDNVELLSDTDGDREVTPLAYQTAQKDNAKSSGGTALKGEVSNVHHRSLERGPLLVAPHQDLVVDTPHGSVSVSAKSMALLVSSEKGLAIYNLHDVRKNAVCLIKDGKSISVAPGSSALLVPSSTGTFEQVNPAQFVRYRQLSSKQFNKSTKLHRAEFDIISLLNGLPAFKELMTSESPETRKTMQSVLKTAAILLQLSNGGEQFKHYLAPEVTAYSTAK